MGLQRFPRPPARGVFAVGVFCVAAIVFSWLILRLPPQVGQFSKYPNAALQYLHGTSAPERLLDFSPLYLGLHIAAFRLCANPLQAIALTQILLLSLAAALLFLILRRHFNPVYAAAGATAFILAKSVVIYGYVFEPEPLVIFLLTALVFCASCKNLPGAAAAGVSLTLCVLTRPSFLPLALAVPVHFWFNFPNRRRSLLASALFLLPVLTGATFMAARNQRLQGEASLRLMNPGTVVFDGNSPLAGGGGAAYPPVVSDVSAMFPDESDYQHAVYRLLSRRSTGKNLTPGETNSFWATKAANYIRDYPGRLALLTARRALYVFHRYRWDDIRVSWAAGRALEEGNTPFVPFALVSALGALGLATGCGSWRPFFLPYAVFVNQAGFMVLVYASDRQRVSLYPFFVFFAIAATARLVDSGRGKRGVGLVITSLFLLAFTIERDRMRDNRHVWEGFTRLRQLPSAGSQQGDNPDFPGVLSQAAKMLALAPWALDSARPAGVPAARGELAELALGELSSLRPDAPSTRLDRALLLIEAGRLDEAEVVLKLLEREGHVFERLNGRIPSPAYHLGRIAVLRGNRTEAVRQLKRALDSAPGDPAILAQLACLTDDAAYAGRIFSYFDNPDADFLLGRACLENGRPELAIAHLERLALALPEYRKGQIYLAAALGDAGEDARAAEVYRGANEQTAATVLLEERIVPIFERLARAGTPEAFYRYGVVLREYGRFPEALRALTRAAAAGYAAAEADLRDLRPLLERSSAR